MDLKWRRRLFYDVVISLFDISINSNFFFVDFLLQSSLKSNLSISLGKIEKFSSY